MGYTTEFTGEFRVVSIATNEYDYLYDTIALEIKKLHLSDEWRISNNKVPDSYCQWLLKSDDAGHYIEWDGGEKFYYYKEWLQYIISTYLLPYGFKLEGEVRYQGEALEDAGYLVIQDNKVIDEKLTRQKHSVDGSDMSNLTAEQFEQWCNMKLKLGTVIAALQKSNTKIKDLELEIKTLNKIIEKKIKIIDILIEKINEPGKVI